MELEGGHIIFFDMLQCEKNMFQKKFFFSFNYIIIVYFYVELFLLDEIKKKFTCV